MAKRKNAMMPVTGGIRRRRSGIQGVSPDGTRIRYNTHSSTLTSDASGINTGGRIYVPGFTGGLVQPVGPTLVSYYSSAKFEPGTTIRWEPSVSFNTTGRMFIGFTDNPEVMATIGASSGTTYGNYVKSLGGVISFPIWQETEVTFPTRTRRKMFDVNNTVATTDPNALDRSAQTWMFTYVESAPANTSLGSFWHHDQVLVEGLHSAST